MYVVFFYGWSVPLKLYVYGYISAGLFKVTCVWLYYCWSGSLKVHVYGYVTAGLFI